MIQGLSIEGILKSIRLADARLKSNRIGNRKQETGLGCAYPTCF
jgi:hypothetical protein